MLLSSTLFVFKKTYIAMVSLGDCKGRMVPSQHVAMTIIHEYA